MQNKYNALRERYYKLQSKHTLTLCDFTAQQHAQLKAARKNAASASAAIKAFLRLENAMYAAYAACAKARAALDATR